MTAADMNTYVRDNGRWLSHNGTGGAPMCRVSNSASIAGFTTGNAVPFDTDGFDLENMHDPVTNNTRITCPTGGDGRYLVGGNFRFDPGSTPTDGAITVSLLRNGTVVKALANMVNIDVFGAIAFPLPATLLTLAAADYLEVLVDFANFSSLDVTQVADYAPYFWAIWLAE